MGARRLRKNDVILNVSDPRRDGGVPREFRADTRAPFENAAARAEPYEPRILPWYRRAAAEPGTIVWMPPYVFTEGVTGVTSATAAQDASRRLLGVLTVDFTLAGVADFLRGITVGQGGVVVLFEQVRPEEVVAILNDHFGLMVALIAEHRGFVVDFLGDSLFAVFGAPETDAAHAEQVVACAIEMQRARTRRNQEHRARHWPPLEMGVGISTGAAVVGNMGSRRRIKYGVVGSIVNLAARFETFTVGGQVLVADSTRQALGDRLVVDGPLEAEGKGVGAVMRLWEVRELRGNTPLVLPSLVQDLVRLPVVLDASLRLFLGKHLDRSSHPAQILRLGAGGAELESSAPLEVFGSVHLVLPLSGEGSAPEALDGKVIALSERDGTRTVVVRFTGTSWDQQERIERFACGETAS